MRLRQVCQEDCKLLWEWVNAPDVRAASFTSGPISWEEHVQWFTNKLNDPQCYQFLALADDIPIGQVRFDVQDDGVEITVSITSDLRGQGYGSQMIRAASAHLFENTGIIEIFAYIRPDNTASIHAFEQAGYRMVGTKVVKGQQALQMVLEKTNSGMFNNNIN